jgi:hypothetical protein
MVFLGPSNELLAMNIGFNQKTEGIETILPEIQARLPGREHAQQLAATIHSYRIQEYARCLVLAGDLPINEVEAALTARSDGAKSGELYTPDELTSRALMSLMPFEHSAHHIAKLEGYVNGILRDCSRRCARFLAAHPGEDPFLLLTEALSSMVDARTLSIMSGASRKWREWTPEFRMDDKKVIEAQRTLPGVNEAALPKLLEKYEDPSSPDAFIGAVKLGHHDIIHILLRRGLLDQDEAFVLGFTMGTARGVDIDNQASRFKEILNKEYHEPYRIPLIKLPAFDLGIQCARASQCSDIFTTPLTDPKYLNMSVGALRAHCGITDQVLEHFFRLERHSVPHSFESLRLPYFSLD